MTGDPTQMHQVLLNLCVNARDAMPEGGELSITMDNFIIDESYAAAHPDSRPGAYVMTEVERHWRRDSPPRSIAYSSRSSPPKGVGEGNGTRALDDSGDRRSHGGFIRVYQRAVGKGTMFSVYLPANTGEAAGDPVPARIFIFRRGTES